jgi:hypothetical protein
LARQRHVITDSVPLAFTQALQELGAGVEVPFDDLHFPMALTDTDGIIRWQNRESIDLVGDRRGSSYVPVVAPDHRQAMQTRLTRFMFGTDGARDDEVEIVDKYGVRRTAMCSSLPIRSGDQVVAILTIARIAPRTSGSSSVPELTPRQMARPARNQLARGGQGFEHRRIAMTQMDHLAPGNRRPYRFQSASRGWGGPAWP